jgi:hypothetical protein
LAAAAALQARGRETTLLVTFKASKLLFHLNSGDFWRWEVKLRRLEALEDPI